MELMELMVQHGEGSACKGSGVHGLGNIIS